MTSASHPMPSACQSITSTSQFVSSQPTQYVMTKPRATSTRRRRSTRIQSTVSWSVATRFFLYQPRPKSSPRARWLSCCSMPKAFAKNASRVAVAQRPRKSSQDGCYGSVLSALSFDKTVLMPLRKRNGCRVCTQPALECREASRHPIEGVPDGDTGRLVRRSSENAKVEVSRARLT